MSGYFVSISGEIQNPAFFAWMPVGFASVPVAVVQISNSFEVTTDAGRLCGRAGDYLIQTEDGRMLPIPRLLFQELLAVVQPTNPRLKEIHLHDL